jgi:hypothetical protein
MDPGRGHRRLLEEDAPRAPTPSKLFNADDAAVALQAGDFNEKEPIDKRSLDYILRSGLAGGLAGCAVGVSRSSSLKG